MSTKSGVCLRTQFYILHTKYFPKEGPKIANNVRSITNLLRSIVIKIEHSYFIILHWLWATRYTIFSALSLACSGQSNYVFPRGKQRLPETSVHASTLKLTCLIEINNGKKSTTGPEIKTISVEEHIVHVMRSFCATRMEHKAWMKWLNSSCA